MRAGDAGEDGDGAALGETAENDARGGDAFFEFFADERVEEVAGAEDARFVVGLGQIVEGCLERGGC